MRDRSWRWFIDVAARSLVPLVAGIWVAATMVGPLRPTQLITSYARLSPALATVDVAAGVALALTGSLSWLFGRRWVGLAALAGSVCWFGPDWAGNETALMVLRAAGLVLGALTLPSLIHLVLSVVPGRSRTRILVVGVSYIVTAGLATLQVALLVPAFDPRCLALCDAGAAVTSLGDRGSSASELARILDWWITALGVGLATWSFIRLALASARTRRMLGPVFVAAGVVGAAWAVEAIEALRPSAETPPLGPTMIILFVVQALGVVALAFGITRSILVERRILSSVQAIGRRLSPFPGTGSLRLALAGALGDPGLRLLYPLPNSPVIVDDDGRVMTAPEPGVVPIERDGRLVAMAVPSRDAGIDALEHGLGAAVRLAVENEGLLAALRHQVLQLRASRARIVDASDTERRRLERDLHDGAQQRLLGVLHELVLARDRSHEDIRGRLDRAVDDTDSVIDALRAVARGIHHSVLTEAGLGAALDALASEAPVPLDVRVTDDLRCRPESESAAWHAVVEVVRQGARLRCEGVEARLARDGDRMRLDLTIEGPSADLDPIPVEDRIGAAGGRVSVTSDSAGIMTFHAELPCA